MVYSDLLKKIHERKGNGKVLDGMNEKIKNL